MGHRRPAGHAGRPHAAAETLGKRLGRTTGWIHRATLKRKGVERIGGLHYERIDGWVR